MSKHSKVSQKQDRDLLQARETILDDVPLGGSPPWAILYPAEYGVGMASLGFQTICAELRTMGVGLERFFSGPLSNFSFETGKSIKNFPFISASVAYEPDLQTIISIFKEWGISHRWRERSESDGPVFGVGGALSYINPLIFSEVADYVVLGDGEPVLEHLVRESRKYFLSGDRKRLWEGLAEHDSIFVPPLHRALVLSGTKVFRRKSFLKDMDRARGKSLWIADKGAFGRTVLIELQRGCKRMCNYCTIPASFGPVRIRSLDRVIRDASSCVHIDNVQIGLVTPEAGDYPYLPDLLKNMKSNGQSVSFASLRVDNMTEEMVEALVRSKRFGVTVAPEAGNDILRAKCGKNFSNELIIKKLEMASRIGVRQVKLYFMIGLPGEDISDLDSIAGLCQEIRDITRLRIKASVGVFVPKPKSRWEMAPMLKRDEAYYRFKRLKAQFAKGYWKGCSLSIQDPKEASLEYSLAWLGSQQPDELHNGKSSKALLSHFDQSSTEKLRVLEELSILGFGKASCQ